MHQSIPNHKHFIYALCDSATQEIKYIGMSYHYPTRLKSHINGGSPKNLWLQSLKSQNIEPIVVILQVTQNRKLAHKAERENILKYQPEFNKIGRTETQHPNKLTNN